MQRHHWEAKKKKKKCWVVGWGDKRIWHERLGFKKSRLGRGNKFKYNKCFQIFSNLFLIVLRLVALLNVQHFNFFCLRGFVIVINWIQVNFLVYITKFHLLYKPAVFLSKVLKSDVVTIIHSFDKITLSLLLLSKHLTFCTNQPSFYRNFWNEGLFIIHWFFQMNFTVFVVFILTFQPLN